MRKLLTVISLMIALTLGAATTTPVWEEVNAPSQAAVHAIELAEGNDLDMVVADGYIYLRTDRTVTVKIFSILGQLISQETIKPGVHRIRMGARGIYILRTGTITRRITL